MERWRFADILFTNNAILFNTLFFGFGNKPSPFHFRQPENTPRPFSFATPLRYADRPTPPSC